MAAARAELEAEALLSRAISTRAMPQRDIADALGVSEGRVSQVLKGGANIRIATLARYLSVLGYKLALTADPVREDIPALVPSKARRSRRSRAPRETFIHTRRRAVDGHEAWDVMFSTMPAGSTEGWSSAGVGNVQVAISRQADMPRRPAKGVSQ